MGFFARPKKKSGQITPAVLKDVPLVKSTKKDKFTEERKGLLPKKTVDFVDFFFFRGDVATFCDDIQSK